MEHDQVLAYELAQWGMWVSPRASILFRHYATTKGKDGFLPARYNKFLIQSHVNDWIRGYFEGTSHVGKISRSTKSIAARYWMELADEEIVRTSQKVSQ
jgi:hypothetical protein